jgi:pyruvate dehydrogenase E1 component alpha subunit
MKSFLLDCFNKISFCRHFENYVYKKIQDKTISIPVYLSAGQESTPCSISAFLKEKNVEPNIFIQHRGHSTYIAFEASPVKLIDELLGLESGCSFGMGGSASIQSIEKNIYGHDGLMGSQVPIAVGHCYHTKHPTIVFMGDASAEEDYVGSAIGWASTKNLPILFVVEDNNLSILTEKKVRRNWNMHELAQAYKVDAYDIGDDPTQIYKHLENVFNRPLLLNIKTVRKFWHSGAGIDGDYFDRYEWLKKTLPFDTTEIDEINKNKVEALWQSHLEKLSSQ